MLLPCSGDPFLTAYWLRNFATWSDEVDQLVIGLIDPGEEVQDHIVGLAPDARIVTIANRKPHGEVMNTLLAAVAADEVMFIEDDAYIRHPGVVDAAFRALADVDVVGTLRNPDEIHGVEYQHLLPCCLFSRRETLMGLPPFSDAIASDGVSRDTFGLASFALRDKKLDVRKPYLIPYFPPARQPFEDWIKDDPPWFHVGGLSMGYGVWLGNDIGQTPYGKDLGWDLACRIAWWERCLSETDGLPTQRSRYRASLDSLIDRQQVDRGEIKAWHAAFKPWVTW